MRRLSSVQMAELALEAMRNSRRLLDDAAALARELRLPSALLLAGLAADELGKHILVASFYSREGTDDEWRIFWRRFRKHTEKLGDALMGAWIGDLLTDDPPPSASAFHKQRLAATYVDLSDDGAVHTPVNAVSREAFEAIYESIDRELNFCEGVMANASPQRLGAVLESLRTSTHGKAVTDLLSELGPEAALAFAMSIRAGMDTEGALAFVKQVGPAFAHLRPGARRSLRVDESTQARGGDTADGDSIS
jgi:AbiV family abortive infection protein